MKVGPEEIARFRQQVESEWRNNIAPFWSRYAPDEKHGGFRGWITNDLRIDEQAEKGVILNSRILWTFSHAFRIYREPAFRSLAERAYKYLIRYFFDHECGGVFWTLNYQGRPLDTRKRTYAQAFALYGLTEFFLAAREPAALDQAFDLFHLIEDRCRDRDHDGYFETFERDWSLAIDQRLSEVDQDEKKSMNTHLHILEAYAGLARATNDSGVKERLRAVIHLFLNRIIHPAHSYLQMFFDETWTAKSEHISFGHDIEGSWLLWEAAQVLDDDLLLARVRETALKMARAVYEKALAADGSLLYEADGNGICDDDRHWWAQSEAVVGFMNAYQLSGNDDFLRAALRVWEFIDRHLIDRENGEWFWKVSAAGVPSPDLPKVSQWKCPYHNGRMCFEISRRLSDKRQFVADSAVS